ncbi:MAG: hypothetical protein OEZ34_01860 [Spirochaetia bacterium]|nr:hypothetical protein [Spirochaetia bacterium]
MVQKFEINFEHKGNAVLFKNNIQISRMQFDALTKIRGFYTDSTPTFFWQELLRVKEEKPQMTVKFSPPSLKRMKRELEYLVESGFFKMESSEIMDNNRKKIEIKFFEIHPALISIIHLM